MGTGGARWYGHVGRTSLSTRKSKDKVSSIITLGAILRESSLLRMKSRGLHTTLVHALKLARSTTSRITNAKPYMVHSARRPPELMGLVKINSNPRESMLEEMS